MLLMFLATLIASVVIFARVIHWRRVRLEFRSPVVINLAESTSPRRAAPVPSPVATSAGAEAGHGNTLKDWQQTRRHADHGSSRLERWHGRR